VKKTNPMCTLKFYTIFPILCILLIAANVSGQNSLSTRVTLSIVNKRFDNALKIIGEKGKVNLCYNSDIIPKNKVVTIKTNNNRLDKILIPLLASVDLQLKEVNDQIIITKSSSGISQAAKSIHPAENTTVTTARRTEISGNLVTVLDTVFYTIHDTIVKTVFDTIRITVYDTKIIRQSNKSFAGNWVPKFSIDISGSMMYQLFKTEKYTAKPEYTPFFAQYGAIEKNKHGYSFASNVSLKNKRTEVSVGIEYFKAGSDINLSELPQNILKKDSTIISTTITYQGIFYEYKVETVPYPVNYDPIRSVVHCSYSYLGFPVKLSYKIVKTNKIEIGICLGLIYSRLVNATSFNASLVDQNPFMKNRNGESIAHQNVSFITGFEIDYPLTNHISFTTSLRLRKSFTSIYDSSFPITETPIYIYPSFSVKYTL